MRNALLSWMRRRGKSFASGQTLRFAAAVLIAAARLTEAQETGTPLADALRQLQRQGLNVVFSSQLVTPEMKVVAEPSSRDPRRRLEELLRPHGLDAVERPGGVLIVVLRQPPAAAGLLRGVVRSSPAHEAMPGVTVKLLETGMEALTNASGRFEIGGLGPGRYTLEARADGFARQQRRIVVSKEPDAVEVSFVLYPLWTEEIIVEPSLITLLADEPSAPVSLSREEIQAIPHLGDDVFRTLGVLPGTTSTDISAQFHIRGGRRDELLVRLDGQELYEPYHLRDFDNALSIVGASTLASVDLRTAAFPVHYGDRMSGVLDMYTVTPQSERLLRLSASAHGAQIEAADSHRQDRLKWLVSLRRGSTDLIGNALDVEAPRFWDSFGKLTLELTPRQSVRIHGLISRDRLDFSDQEQRHLDTEYDSSYVWMTHEIFVRKFALAETTASVARLERDRSGFETDEERSFDVRDERDVDVTSVAHSWMLEAGKRQLLRAGLQYRRFDTVLDYDSVRHFNTPLVAIRAEPREGSYSFRDRLHNEYLSVYVSDRISPHDSLTLDAGVRYDRQSLLGDRLLSPRLSAAWAFRPASVLRLAWGRFAQSQRGYELMVEDADPHPYPTERSQHWVAGFEHLFPGSGPGWLSSLRVEAYRRPVSNPRPRYESLYKPFDAFPEGEPDRVRIEPERSLARGIELLARGRSTRRVDWWLNYAWASTRDRIDGRDVPRRIDQTHTLNVDVNYRLAPQWNLNMALSSHTGWPTTPVSIERGVDSEGEIEVVPLLGALNSERLPAYRRLDVRLSRQWETRRGPLSLFFDAHNLFLRKNVSGLDMSIDDETGDLLIDREYWPRFFASAGIVWEIR